MIGGRIQKSCWSPGKDRRFGFFVEGDNVDATEEKKIWCMWGKEINIDKPSPSDYSPVATFHFLCTEKKADVPAGV